jgi:predicted branched-subunit amino acid permease
MGEPAVETGFRAGVRAILPFTIAVVGFGISFGVLARSAGMGPLAATVMSGTTFAGSAQFAATGIL